MIPNYSKGPGKNLYIGQTRCGHIPGITLGYPWMRGTYPRARVGFKFQMRPATRNLLSSRAEPAIITVTKLAAVAAASAMLQFERFVQVSESDSESRVGLGIIRVAGDSESYYYQPQPRRRHT